MRTITRDNLNDLMGFGHVILVSHDGSVTEPSGVSAPEEVLYVSGDEEPSVEDGWELLTGRTGQHGYRGAVMHASEFIGGGLADDILSTPGYYVALVVDSEPEGDTEDPESVGWAIARKDLPSI